MTRVVIATIGIGGWYPAGVARLISQFRVVDPGREVMAWVNTLPPGAPNAVIKNGWDYTGYCAKPFALRAAMDARADIAILMDAAFWPIRTIDPLVEHITGYGYYLCENGYRMGEWCKDAALGPLGLTRSEAMEIPEASSYCVGLNFHHRVCRDLVEEWCDLAMDGITFPGPHTRSGEQGRNPGHVSDDLRVRGHRHDQTALSAITWRLGMREHIARPQFTAYDGFQDNTTVLVNRGM